MVFSSLPTYLDQPNWQQQQPSYQTVGGSGTIAGSTDHTFHPPLPPPPPPPPPPPMYPSGGPGSVRPGSMADRARMENLSIPEVALKCPRCDSSNTKFCYFNNYSLSQPRHFCKTCRRYWTRGGALRNVPVGGGCRRNKRSNKGSSSTSNNNNSRSSPVSSSSGGVGGGAISTATTDIIGSQFPPMRFMGSNMHHQYSNSGLGEFGLNYSGISIPSSMAQMSTGDLNFFLGGGGGGGSGSLSYLSARGEMEQPWRLPQMHQLPFFGSGLLDQTHGLFPIGGGGDGGGPAGNYGGGKTVTSASGMNQDQDSSSQVKMENNQEMNMARQFLSGTMSAWTDLSGFSSSSTSHPL